VKASVKSDYAARAILGLARHYPSKAAVRVEDLAAGLSMPPKYLVVILNELQGQGIARGIRGKGGGYLLARSPAEITLGDVLRAVDGAIFDAPALNDAGCPPELRSAWLKLQQAMVTTVDAISFQQLLEESAAKEKMYYI
jgi:Rrf2 family transcriptional regulator, cysteine metabolism repressor